MTMVDTRAVCGGVDTHLDFHVAACLDQIGGLLGIESFETTEAGYRKLLDWLGGFGTVVRAAPTPPRQIGSDRRAGGRSGGPVRSSDGNPQAA